MEVGGGMSEADLRVEGLEEKESGEKEEWSWRDLWRGDAGVSSNPEILPQVEFSALGVVEEVVGVALRDDFAVV